MTETLPYQPDNPYYTIGVIDDDATFEPCLRDELSRWNRDNPREGFLLTVKFEKNKDGITDLLTEIKRREERGERTAAIAVDRWYGPDGEWGRANLQAIKEKLPKGPDGTSHRNWMTVIYCSDSHDMLNIGKIAQTEQLTDQSFIKFAPPPHLRNGREEVNDLLKTDAKNLIGLVVKCLKEKLALEKAAASELVDEANLIREQNEEEKQLVIKWLRPLQDYHRGRSQGPLKLTLQNGSCITVEELLENDHLIKQLWFQFRVRQNFKVEAVR